MKEYDVIIIGSGSGANLVNDALSHNKTVALVDKGPAGGTCLNVGCIPTKMIVYPADRIMEIRDAQKFGITAEIKAVDFSAIMERMRKAVKKSHDNIQKTLNEAEDFDYYGGEAHFTDEYTLDAAGRTIKGKMIFIVSGARPFIPIEYRLPPLTTALVPTGVDAHKVRTRLLEEYNIEIAAGFGALKDQVWRIGLMGYSSRRENITLFLGALRELLGK